MPFKICARLNFLFYDFSMKTFWIIFLWKFPSRKKGSGSGHIRHNKNWVMFKAIKKICAFNGNEDTRHQLKTSRSDTRRKKLPQTERQVGSVGKKIGVKSNYSCNAFCWNEFSLAKNHESFSLFTQSQHRKQKPLPSVKLATSLMSSY